MTILYELNIIIKLCSLTFISALVPPSSCRRQLCYICIHYHYHFTVHFMYKVSGVYVTFHDFIPEVISGPNVTWTWVRFWRSWNYRYLNFKMFRNLQGYSRDLRDIKHGCTCTFSVMAQRTFQSTRNGVPEWELLWPMYWTWWSAELATAVTGPLDFREIFLIFSA